MEDYFVRSRIQGIYRSEVKVYVRLAGEDVSITAYLELVLC